MEHTKKGFTLAEVLITLGIIGIVAAMSAPALIQHAAAAKTGPAMSRAVTSLANGLQAFLFAHDSTKLDTSGDALNPTEDLDEIMKAFDFFIEEQDKNKKKK